MGLEGINSGLSGISNINSNTANVEKESSSDTSFGQTLKNAFDNKNPAQLKKACQDFEGILLNMMYKEMRSTVQKSELIPSDVGTEIFQSMMDEELVKSASQSGGIGLADVLYKQLSKHLRNEEASGDSVIEDK